MQLTDVFCRRVVRGIAAFGADSGWEWLLVPLEDGSAPVFPLTTEVDGLIGCFGDAQSASEVAQSGLPAVNISSTANESNIPCVASDDEAVGRVAAEYLLSLGLAHFGFFGAKGCGSSQARERGFTAMLAAAGFGCSAFHLPREQPSASSDELIRWIASLPKPAAIFASNDFRAIHLLSVCQKSRIAVPDAVTVLGADNDEVLCRVANPTLSSVALSAQRIGYESARTLERLMRGQGAEQRMLLIPPVGVVPRQSSRHKVIVDPEVAAAVRYIAQHVKDNLQVVDVLREVLVSRRSLDQRFLKTLGRTPAQEISRAQVEMAKQVLAETDEPMAKVAAMAGFSNAKQFGATFRTQTGIVPSAYRREHQK